jgi:hypothetical protein
MRRLKSLINLFILCVPVAQADAQQLVTYKTADSLYNSGSFKKSAKTYFNLFNRDHNHTSDLNLFNASKACARAHLTDSAFKFLSLIVGRNDRDFFDAITTNPDFKKLQRDKRWDVLMWKIRHSQTVFNAPVAAELAAMHRQRLDMEEKKRSVILQFGMRSMAYKLYKDTIAGQDSLNSLKLKSIIHTYGWMSPPQVGDDEVRSLVYLFQKLKPADQKRYYPLMVTAFRKGDLDAANFAIITDKISLYDTGRQIYGTQVNYTNNLLPVENKDSLNIRRVSIGLKPLE